VQFNHDNMIGVYLAEELINLDADDQWTSSTVATVFDKYLVRFVTLDAELVGLRQWTRRLQEAFAVTETVARCAVINELLAVGAGQVHLSIHDDFPPHLHFVQDEQGLTERVQAATIGGIAIFAVEARAERMGICSRPGCERVYVDTSRAGRRAYCSPVCGNTHAVHRYRERKATAHPVKGDR
jgi:predicted RNA-binding Zn ribbon-like protein